MSKPMKMWIVDHDPLSGGNIAATVVAGVDEDSARRAVLAEFAESVTDEEIADTTIYSIGRIFAVADEHGKLYFIDLSGEEVDD